MKTKFKIILVLTFLILSLSAFSASGIIIKDTSDESETVRFYVQVHLDGICTPTSQATVFARNVDTGIQYSFQYNSISGLYFADIAVGIYLIVAEGVEGYRPQSIEYYSITESNPDLPLCFILPKPKAKIVLLQSFFERIFEKHGFNLFQFLF